MDTTTGLDFRARDTARQIASAAGPKPPGLSTRNTTALTASSSRASLNALVIVSEPATEPPKPDDALSPVTISPTAYTRAIFGRLSKLKPRLAFTYRLGVTRSASLSRASHWS